MCADMNLRKMADNFTWIGQYVLDADGRPQRATSLLEWAEWLETFDRQIARTDFGPQGVVSTVFLGLDQGFLFFQESESYKPTLWETMVFNGNPPEVLDCRRYTSREDAIKGHQELVQMWTGN